MNKTKILLIFVFFCLFLNTVYAQNFEVNFVEAGRFLCKNQTTVALNYNNTIDIPNILYDNDKLYNFNRGLNTSLSKEGFTFWQNFDFNRSNYYIIFKNETEYHIDTDGNWFLIIKVFKQPIGVNPIKFTVS